MVKMVPSDGSYLTEFTGKNATGSTKKRSWQSKIYCNNSRILNFLHAGKKHLWKMYMSDLQTILLKSGAEH